MIKYYKALRIKKSLQLHTVYVTVEVIKYKCCKIKLFCKIAT